jgi:type IV fimbrial biogenesis protein FimT
MSPASLRQAGFTVVELMIVVAIVAVLMAMAAPSFSEYLSKRRVDGVMSELVTDMHYARSEAVSRNETVKITFGTDCYVIHRSLVPGNAATVASCTRTTKSITPAAAEIKTVQLDEGRPLTIDPGALTFVEFEPVRGTATNSSASATVSVDVRSTTGINWLLRAVLTSMGRVETCSPSGAGHFPGYSTACTS